MDQRLRDRETREALPANERAIYAADLEFYVCRAPSPFSFVLTEASLRLAEGGAWLAQEAVVAPLLRACVRIRSKLCAAPELTLALTVYTERATHTQPTRNLSEGGEGGEEVKVLNAQLQLVVRRGPLQRYNRIADVLGERPAGGLQRHALERDLGLAERGGSGGLCAISSLAPS